MIPSVPPQQQKTIQQLLDEELQAQGILHQMNNNIQAIQKKVIGQDWWDGNFIIKWSRYINQQKYKQLSLLPKDRIFSLSNIGSFSSGQLLKIENQLLEKNQTQQKSQARKKFCMKPKKGKTENNKEKKEKKRGYASVKRRRIKRPNKNKIIEKKMKLT